MDDIQVVERRIRAALSRVRIAARGVLARVVLDNGRLLGQVKGLTDESLRDAQLLQQYGIVSWPKPGADGVVVFLGGAPGAKVVVATYDARYTLQSLQEGEVALYTDEGDKIHLHRGGIRIESAGSIVIQAADHVQVQADTCEVSAGDVKVNSTDISLGPLALEHVLKGESFLALFNTHIHKLGVLPTTEPDVPLPPTVLSLTTKVL